MLREVLYSEVHRNGFERKKKRVAKKSDFEGDSKFSRRWTRRFDWAMSKPMLHHREKDYFHRLQWKYADNLLIGGDDLLVSASVSWDVLAVI